VVLEKDGEDQLDPSLLEMNKYCVVSRGEEYPTNNKTNKG
jgi:hypothetical protein